METAPQSEATTRPSIAWPSIAWGSVVLLGAIIPLAAILVLLGSSVPAGVAAVGGPALSLGLMGTGMIGAAAAQRFGTGLLLAILSGVGLLATAGALGHAVLAQPLAIGLATLAAGVSFAARGALFATSAVGKGWFIALAVVAGEGALLITAAIEPGSLPAWLLALLPAQWASLAIQSALAGGEAIEAWAPLMALGGTAAATAFVTQMWPRRWPYLIMFSTWLGLSALVYSASGAALM